MSHESPIKHYDDGLQVVEPSDGLHAQNQDPGLHLNEYYHPANNKRPGSSHSAKSPVPVYESNQTRSLVFPDKPNPTGTEKEVDNGRAIDTSRPPNRKRLIWFAVAGFILLALALGLGLGLGLGLKHSSSSAGISDGSSENTTSSGQNSGSGSIMNSTSLAAVVTPDTVRNVFYQYDNGSVAAVSNLMGSWQSSIITSARNDTPISAIVIGNEIVLFYVGEENHLRYSLYNGAWQTSVDTLLLVSDATTSISVTPVTCKDASSSIVLFYEDESRAIKGFLGSAENLTQIKWTDFSANLTGGIWSTLGSPITTVNSYLDKGLTLNAFFYNQESATNSDAKVLEEVAFSNFSTCHISTGSNITATGLTDNLAGLTSQNDLVTFPLLSYPWYILNGKLESVNGPGGLKTLNSQFPFTRLASINTTSTNNLYLYSQLNESVLLEHIAADRGDWTTNTISIAGD